jgi:single-stranded-DNA-specific exonuclease
MAAGITVERERLGDFRAFVEERLTTSVEAARAGEALMIDAALTAGGARVEVVEELERAGPFGAGNPEPVFVFPAHRIVDAAEVGNGHLRIRAKSGDGAFLNGIAFRQANEPLGKALMGAKGEAMHLAGSLAIDRWGGGERVQLRLLDAAKPVKRV